MKTLSDDAIKEAKVGHVAILVNGKPQVFDGDRAVARKAESEMLRQVDTWLKVHDVYFVMSPSVRDEWQEFKKLEEEVKK